eukprot:4672563-Prymnesium_polylepis.1
MSRMTKGSTNASTLSPSSKKASTCARAASASEAARPHPAILRLSCAGGARFCARRDGGGGRGR